ncbi:MAG: alpha/beta fold hydrolase [Geminicoccaceae bacterium]
MGSLARVQHPPLVAALVLVGSGPFEARHAVSIKPTRLACLTEAERQEYAVLASDLEDPAKLERAMQLFEKMDTYAPNGEPRPRTVFNKAIYDAVWEEAASLRRSGELLQIVATIRCPVTAIHGDYDPHPAEGVEIPLRSKVPRSNFVLLDRCGHKPWDETHARDAFYRELEKAIG